MPSRVAFAVVVTVALVLTNAVASHAQVFELVDSFAGCPAEGCDPAGDAAHPDRLILGPDNNFYGTSPVDHRPQETEPRGWGTVFRITPTGNRSVLHYFDGAGPGGCGPTGITFGGDGALYGVGSACGATGAALIFRISGGGFEPLQEFPLTGVVPRTLIAGSNGAFYGLGSSAGTTVLFKWSGTSITVLQSYLPPLTPLNLVRASDGRIYFPTRFTHPVIDPFGDIRRITATDQVEMVNTSPFPTFAAPLTDLVVGADGSLYGAADVRANFSPVVQYRMTLAGTLSYPSMATGGVPIAVPPDRSIYLSTGDGDNGAIARLMPDGSLLPVHTFEGDDGSGAVSTLVRGADGHYYGTTTEGGEHGLGVFFRLRQPTVDIKANGVDGPITIGAGGPLQISMAFDAPATEVVNPAEVYLAVVTPSLSIFWATAVGFAQTPTPFYVGPLTSFGDATVINIPDASVIPGGDYYWVAIVDADANRVPNGMSVDVVKTTKAAALTTQRGR